MHPLDQFEIHADHPSLTDFERQVLRNAAARLAGLADAYEAQESKRFPTKFNTASAAAAPDAL